EEAQNAVSNHEAVVAILRDAASRLLRMSPVQLCQRIPMHRLRLFICLSAFIASAPAFAARCGGDFNTFVQNVSAGAASAGISQPTMAQALGGAQQDFGVLPFDRRERGPFTKPFEQYVSPRVGSGRNNGGRA